MVLVPTPRKITHDFFSRKKEEGKSMDCFPSNDSTQTMVGFSFLQYPESFYWDQDFERA